MVEGRWERTGDGHTLRHGRAVEVSRRKGKVKATDESDNGRYRFIGSEAAHWLVKSPPRIRKSQIQRTSCPGRDADLLCAT